MDPFNAFLKQKISEFNRRTNTDLLYSSINKSEFQHTRELARLSSSPLNKEERRKLNPQELGEEDNRLSQRKDFLEYDQIANEVMKLFSSQ